jgi:hypothetical protein
MRFTVTEKRLFPEGDYNFSVEDAQAATASTGRNMIETKLLVSDGNGNKTVVYDRLMDWNIEAFQKSIGDEVVYGDIDVEPYEYAGRTGRLHLIQGEWKGEPRNEVAKYLPSITKHPAKREVAVGPDGTPDDLPF